MNWIKIFCEFKYSAKSLRGLIKVNVTGTAVIFIAKWNTLTLKVILLIYFKSCDIYCCNIEIFILPFSSFLRFFG